MCYGKFGGNKSFKIHSYFPKSYTITLLFYHINFPPTKRKCRCKFLSAFRLISQNRSQQIVKKYCRLRKSFNALNEITSDKGIKSRTDIHFRTNNLFRDSACRFQLNRNKKNVKKSNWLQVNTLESDYWKCCRRIKIHHFYLLIELEKCPFHYLYHSMHFLKSVQFS